MYKIFRYKKGTDKPIEIFIALFIILAVAMVILKMFSSQIQDKTKELQQIEQREKFNQAKGNAKRECDEICTNALQNDCNPQQQAQFCQHKLLDGLDVNMDGDTMDYSEDLLGGIGVCEDSIYCPHVTSCQCGQQLTMVNCVRILLGYYEQNIGMGHDKACDLLFNRIDGETCTIKDYDLFWLTQIVDDMVDKHDCPDPWAE